MLSQQGKRPFLKVKPVISFRDALDAPPRSQQTTTPERHKAQASFHELGALAVEKPSWQPASISNGIFPPSGEWPLIVPRPLGNRAQCPVKAVESRRGYQCL